MTQLSQLIYLFPVIHQLFGFPSMPLSLRKEFDSAVPVLFVIPLGKAMHSVASRLKLSKRFAWITWPILQSSENGFSKRIVITNPWTPE